MSKEKKIAEMACDMCTVIHNCSEPYKPISSCESYKCAKIAVEKGYSKQSKGHWKLGKSGCMYFCSCCEYAAHPREENEWKFCPNCGAKMDVTENGLKEAPK